MTRDKDDKTRLSYWFPKVQAAGLPVPTTRIITLTREESTALTMHLFGEGPADELHRLHAKIAGAADEIGGVPFFLRTDFTSAKHDWKDTCCVRNADLIPHHIHAIWEYSELADMMGLLCDVWLSARC